MNDSENTMTYFGFVFYTNENVYIYLQKGCAKFAPLYIQLLVLSLKNNP